MFRHHHKCSGIALCIARECPHPQCIHIHKQKLIVRRRGKGKLVPIRRHAAPAPFAIDIPHMKLADSCQIRNLLCLHVKPDQMRVPVRKQENILLVVVAVIERACPGVIFPKINPAQLLVLYHQKMSCIPWQHIYPASNFHCNQVIFPTGIPVSQIHIKFVMVVTILRYPQLVIFCDHVFIISPYVKLGKQPLAAPVVLFRQRIDMIVQNKKRFSGSPEQ